MNQGSNPPSGGQPGGKGRRRRRGRRGPVAQGAAPQHGRGPGQAQGSAHGQNQGQGQGPGRNQNARRFGKKRPAGRKLGGRPSQREPIGGGIYSAPMDHSYRAAQGNNDGNTHNPTHGRTTQSFGKQFLPAEPEPLTVISDAPARIYAFVDDLFFMAKIQETSRKMNIKVEFVKTDKDVYERMGLNGK